MRAVVQRALSARVMVGQEQVGAIDRGLFVLLGVGRDDAERDSLWIADKVARLRVLSDEAGKMNRSVLDVGAPVLLVSQFTLYADLRRGRRPGFEDAMPPEPARVLYERTALAMRALGLTVATGRFGADMHIDARLDGPVTLLLDSKDTG